MSWNKGNNRNNMHGATIKKDRKKKRKKEKKKERRKKERKKKKKDVKSLEDRNKSQFSKH